MEFDTILVERMGAVARLTLNRPERANALSQAMLAEIGQALDALEGDIDVRAIIVRGAGSTFSSGFDLKEQMQRRPRGAAQWQPILRRDFDTIMRFWHSPSPPLPPYAGRVSPGPVSWRLPATLPSRRLTLSSASPELKFGAGIVVMILPWLVGPKVAKEIILTGEDRIEADRALAIGMINRIVPAQDLDDTSLRLARHIAVIDPKLVKETKRAINRALEAQGLLTALEDALAIDLGIEAEGSADKARFMEIAHRDGLKAALAWRDARFPRG